MAKDIVNAAGTYKSSTWFTVWRDYIDGKFPGSGSVLDQAAGTIPWAQLMKAITIALTEWQAGKDFLTILRDALAALQGVSPAATQQHVHIADMTFDPSPLIIGVGDCVDFHNHDTQVHTVTDDAGGFDSGDIQPGETWTHVFDTVGKFGYHCEYHKGMLGVVVVS